MPDQSPLQKNAMNLVDFMRTGGLGSTTTGNSINDELDFIKKYDPNAKLNTRQINQGGGDQGDKFVDQQYVDYDQSKLPKMKDGYVANYNLSPDTPYSSRVTHGGTPMMNQRLDRVEQDPNYGYIMPKEDMGTIDEKANNAQQNKEGGLFSQLGNAIVPSDKPWMAIPTAIGAGITGSALSGMDKAIGNFGLNAISSGGKSLTDPLSYVSAGLGVAAPNLPPDVLKTLGYIKTAYGWIKNPIGSAANLAVNTLINR